MELGLLIVDWELALDLEIRIGIVVGNWDHGLVGKYDWGLGIKD